MNSDQFSDCPACSHLLHTTQYEGFEARVCTTGCGGIWLKARDIESLADQPRVIERMLAATDYVMPMTRPQTRCCPECSCVLNASLIRGEVDVEIDTCPKCLGIWFDKGEIVTLIQLHRQAKQTRTQPKHDPYNVDVSPLDEVSDFVIMVDTLGTATELTVDSVSFAVNQAPEVLDLAVGLPEATLDIVGSTASAIADGAAGGAHMAVEAVEVVGSAAEGFLDLLGGLGDLFNW